MHHSTDDVAEEMSVLDITGERCPMTVVRARLALDRLESGRVILIRLRGTEPERSVPALVTALGHEIISCESEDDGTRRLLARARVS